MKGGGPRTESGREKDEKGRHTNHKKKKLRKGKNAWENETECTRGKEDGEREEDRLKGLAGVHSWSVKRLLITFPAILPSLVITEA